MRRRRPDDALALEMERIAYKAAGPRYRPVRGVRLPPVIVKAMTAALDREMAAWVREASAVIARLVAAHERRQRASR
jgi:hypothetical protein